MPASIDGSSASARGPALHADALAALAGVVELELVLLGDDLLGQPGDGLRLGACGGLVGVAPATLQELEGHDSSGRDQRTGWADRSSAARPVGSVAAAPRSAPEPVTQPLGLVRELGLAGAGALDDRRRRLAR